MESLQRLDPNPPQLGHQYHQVQISGDARVHLGNTYNISPNEDEAQACLSALFLTDPRDDRAKLVHTKGSRVDGTCKWIKTNALFDSWFRSHSQLLWLSGGPGKGKTMLSIFLAEELERIAKNSPDTLFLQYFCDNKDEKRNTGVTVLRGLVFQLLQLRPKLFDYILPSFKIQKASLFTSSSFETLWRIFETMLCDPTLGTIYCVLDGLDECDEALLVVLLKKFKAFFSTEFTKSLTCHFNLIVLSRDHPDFIPEILSSFSRIRLDPDVDREVNNDIYRFIEVKVDELSVYRQYPELLYVLVKEIFQNRAQGTFLWVGIVAKALRKYKATEVEKALDLFPPGLDELYARILLQIDVDRREIAAKILRWTVLAIRPLTLSELSVAIDVKPSIGFSCDKVIRHQVSYCGYFLMIKKDEVGLIHQSAKDYLLRKSCDSNPELEYFRVKEDIGNLEVARKCFYYLQNGAFTDGKVDLKGGDTSRLKDFPLLSYAAIYWTEHAKSLARSEDIFSLSLPFYTKKSLVRESWLETYWAVEMYGSLPDSFTLLHLASFFGILPLAENLILKKGWINKVKRLLFVNQRDGNGCTALFWAAEGGHEAVVRLLLEKGADVEAKDKHGGTALYRAVMGGHEAVVRLLLEKGADVEAKDKQGGTALYRAAEGGHKVVVRLLLEKGVGVEAKGKHGGTATALYRAAERGHEAVVRLLLEKGADVEVKGKHGWTALFTAAERGHEAVVQQLLEKGADVETKGKHGGTALFMAAERGHEAVVQLLLEKGADVEAKDEHGWTALSRAALGGREAVVRLLLEKGADVEAKDEYGWTALFMAAVRGHEAVVRLLLEKGADIEAKDEHGWTALYRAAERGHEAVMRQLLTPLNS